MSRLVAFLVFPDFQLLDLAGPLVAFEMTMRDRGPSPYRLKVIALEPGTIATSSGAAMAAEPLDAAQDIDTLIVVGGRGTPEAMACGRTRAFLQAQAGRVRRLGSVCSGAFVLAAAGLLDGRRAVTHWRQCANLERLFPKVKVEPDRIFIRDGDIWTSAGVTAGIDLALALIADDLGEPVALRAAQEMVVYHRRPGGQSQFSALLEVGRPQGRFAALISWAREHLAEPLTVERLAEQAGMSPRHFVRLFTAEMAVTPAKAVERLRLEAARERVEAGRDPIDAVAGAVGFGDPERMRRAFIRAFGQPPQAMRRTARQA